MKLIAQGISENSKNFACVGNMLVHHYKKLFGKLDIPTSQRLRKFDANQ